MVSKEHSTTEVLQSTPTLGCGSRRQQQQQAFPNKQTKQNKHQ